MAQFLSVVVGVAGFALVAGGLFMAWPPLGVIAAGVLLVRAALAVDSGGIEA